MSPSMTKVWWICLQPRNKIFGFPKHGALPVMYPAGYVVVSWLSLGCPRSTEARGTRQENNILATAIAVGTNSFVSVPGGSCLLPALMKLWHINLLVCI